MLVSVIMLTYNHEDYIIQAINGILAQQVNFEYELIIGNDASTDNSDEVIKKHLKSCGNQNIKYILNDRNKGVIENYILLFEKAKGKYLAICEGDDYWTDSLKLQKQVDFLEANPHYSFCWTRFKTLNQQTHKLTLDLNSKYFPNQEEFFDFDFETFYKGWHIGNLTLVYRKNFINIENHKKFEYFRDVHVIAQLLKKGKGSCLNFVSAVYRKHDGGIHTSISSYDGYRIGYETHKEIYLDNPFNIYLKKKYLHSFKNFIAANIQDGFLFKAFTMSIWLFFLNWSIIDFLKHMKRILTKLIKN
jgi:glycosyltransferase involved in cell wall biosynthesis